MLPGRRAVYTAPRRAARAPWAAPVFTALVPADMAQYGAALASIGFGGAHAALWTQALSKGYGATVDAAARGVCGLAWASFALQIVSLATDDAPGAHRASLAAHLVALLASAIALGGTLPGMSLVSVYQQGEADSGLQQAILLAPFASGWALAWMLLRRSEHAHIKRRLHR